MSELHFYRGQLDDGSGTVLNFESGFLNFREFECTFKRSPKWHGLFYDFPSEFQFYGKPYDYLENAYATNGIEAKVTLKVEVLEGFAYSILFEGELDFATRKLDDISKDFPSYSPQQNEGKIIFISASSGDALSEKLNSRSKNKTGVDNLFTLDNIATAPLAGIQLNTHSKAIPLLSLFVPQVPPYFEKIIETLKTYSIGEVSDLQYNEDGTAQATNPTFTAPDNDTYNFSIEGVISGDYDLQPGAIPSSITISYNINGGAYTQLQLIDFQTSGAGSFSEPVSLSWQLVLNASDTVNIRIQVLVQNDSDPGNESFIEATYELESRILRESIEGDSLVNSFLVYELGNKLLENTTSVQDVLRSDLLGRIDSTPTSYLQDGTLSLIAITNGFSLRKAINGKSVKMSIDSFFNGLNSLKPIGLGVEGDKIRLEAIEYFYDATQDPLLTFENIPNISLEVAPEYYFNQFKYGYETAETTTVKLNDEFNFSIEASSYHKKVDAVYDIQNELIGGGYTIEYQRRGAGQPDGLDYDNDNFLLAVVRDGGSFKTEKDENFTSVTGVLSPETSYNLRYSPARCLYQHRKVLASCFYNLSFSEIVPKDFFGNPLLTTDLGGVVLSEDAILQIDTNEALWIPERISFEAPMAIETYYQLKAEPYRLIRVSPENDIFFSGFILEVTYNPYTTKAQFTLLRYS